MTGEEIAARLKVLRIRSGKSMGEVGEYLGLGIQGYNRLESGPTQLKVTLMLKLCDLYGIRVQDFFNDPESVTAMEKEEIYKHIGPIVGPAFDTIERFHKMSLELQNVLKATASLKHGLDRIGIKGKKSGRRFR